MCGWKDEGMVLHNEARCVVGKMKGWCSITRLDVWLER